MMIANPFCSARSKPLKFVLLPNLIFGDNLRGLIYFRDMDTEAQREEMSHHRRCQVDTLPCHMHSMLPIDIS